MTGRARGRGAAPPQLPASLRWAVLAIVLPLAGPRLRADGPAGAPAAKATVLPPLSVHDEAICSFGFSFTCFGDPQTRRIRRLMITDVQQGSRADTLGLMRGDEILEVDGIRVTDLKGGLGRDGDLMRLFVNREYGATIRLLVAIHGSLYRITLPARPASRRPGP